MNILKKSLPKFLSLCKIFAAATLLFLCNPSQGINLPANSVFLSFSALSANVSSDENNSYLPTLEAMNETVNEFSSPLPAPAPAPGDQTVCEGGTASFQAVGGPTYQWEESIGGLPWVPIAGQIASTLTRTGVTLSMNGNQYRCVVNGVPGDTMTLYVNPLPVPIIAGPVSLCAGATGVTYTTEALMTGYTWNTSSGGTITSGQGSNAITVNWNTAGAQTVSVNYTNGNSCTAASPTIWNVTVNPVTPPTIIGLASVCVGSTGIPYTTEAFMSSYTWNISPGGTITSGAGTNTIIVNWNTTGAKTVSVNYTNGSSCTASSPAIMNVTVNALPVPTITGPASVCPGATGINYITEASMSGYIWNISSGGTITSGAGTSSVMVSWNNAGAQNISVNYINGNSCTASIATVKSITVNPLPVPTILGPTSVCAGSTGNSYTTQPSMSGYTWSVSSGGTIASGAGTNSITVNWNTVGPQTVSVNYTNGNLCTATVATVSNVTVNPLPVPTITPSAAVCVGTTGVSYSTETSMSGYVWSTSAGGTITSGQGSNAILVNWNTAGAQTVSVNYTNGNSCMAASSTVRNITVNPLPSAAGAISGSPNVCQGQNTVIYSVPAILNATGYVWSVPTGATVTAGSNTNSISVDFSPTAASGNVTVYGTNGCGNGANSVPYTVNLQAGAPLMAGPIGGDATVCQGANGVTYSIPPLPAADSYVWNLPFGASVVGVNNTNSITVNFANNATSGNITVYGVNGCGNGVMSVPFPVTLLSLPSTAGIIIGLSTVCQGQAGVAYSVAPITDATGYVWSLPGVTIETGAGTEAIVVDFLSTASSGNVTVYGTNGCGNGGLSPLHPLTVNSLPVAAGLISGPSSVCPGQTNVNFTVPLITYATGYAWNLPTGATITAGTNTRSITVDFSPTATSGNISVNGTNICGDGIISSNHAITVGTPPGAAGTVSGPATVCQGQPGVIYSVPDIPNATNYIWSLPAGAAIVSGANTKTITVNYSSIAVSGNITVYGQNTCGTGAISPSYAITVTALPVAPGIINGDNVVCQGQTGVNYTVPVIANATGYNWVLPIGASITSGGNTNSIQVNFSASALGGNISVQGTNPCGSGSSSMNVPVTVNPLPDAAGVVSGTAIVCQGQNGVPYSTALISNATGYVWTLPVGATISSGANSPNITVDFAAGATSGNVSVHGTTPCGSGLSSANFPVTVQSTPGSAGIITGSPTVCQGYTSVSYTVPVIPFATGYVWTLPAGASITAGTNTNSILVSYSTTASPGNVTVYGTNSCSNGIPSSLPVTVNLLPAVAGAISGSPTVCEGATGVVFSVPPISNATGYSWSLPSGAIVTAGNNTSIITVSFPAGTNSGNISVLGTNGCGNGITSPAFSLTVNKLPSSPGVIIGDANVCQNQTGVTYTVPAIANATAYVWSVPAGATITAGPATNTITVSFSSTAVSGNITVQGTNACGSGPISADFPVNVQSLPAAAGVIAGGSLVCQGENARVYSVPPIVGATQYNWTVPAGVTIVSGQGTNSITVNFSTTAMNGNIQVSGHNNCGDGIPSTLAFTVDPLPVGAGAITGLTPVCQGISAVTYTVPPITNATNYIWTLPVGASITSGANTNSITVNYSASATSGSFTVKGSNTCGNGVVSPTLVVTVQTVPNPAGAITGSSVVCQGQNNVLYNVPPIANASGYIWTLPLGASIVSGNNTNTIIVDFSPTASSGILSVYGTNACGNSSTSNLPISVSLIPAPAGVISGNQTLCQGTNGVTYTVPLIANALGYTWNLPTGATIVAGDNTNSITVNFSTSAISGNISVFGTNGCGSGPVSNGLPVAIDLLPAAAGAISGSPAVCQGSTGKIYSVPSISHATTYNWTVPSGATIMSGASTNTITVDFAPGASSGVITVYGSNGCGDGTPSSNFDVTVAQLPDAAGPITGTGTVCSGSTGMIYSVAGITGATGYSWTFPAGATITSGANTNSIVVSFSGSASSGNITVRGTNVCGNGAISASFPITVQSLPSAAGNITGTSPVCQGAAGVSYSVAPIAGTTSYVWTLPLGASIASGSNTNSITVNYSNTSSTGVVKVYGTNSCGNGVASSDFPVTVNPLPAAAALITGPAVACQGSTGIVYSIPAIASATSYLWTLPPGVSITAGSGTNIITVTYTPSSASGTISVFGTNSCGNGAASSLPVTVNPNPTLTSALTPAAVCSNTVFSYIPSGTPGGVTFSWTRAAVAGISNSAASGTGNPNETLINTTTAPVSVTYVYSVSANGCTGSTTYNVVVLVNPAPVLSSTLAPPQQCNNTVFSYTPGSTTAGTTYAWARAIIPGISNPAAFGNGSVNETLINTTTAPVNVTYVYTLNANGCSNVQNVVVAVNPTPLLNSLLAPPAICSNSVFSYTPTSLTPGTLFSWTRAVVAGISNGVGSGTDNPNETLINTTNASISVTYVYILNFNGCANSQNVTVSVKPNSSLTSSLTPSAVCSGTTFNYTPVPSVGGTTLSWSRALTTGISNAAASGSGDPNETLVSTTTAQVDVTYVYTLNSGGCTNTNNVVVRVNPTPVLSSPLTPSAICNNSVFNYNPTSLTPGTTFSWNRGALANISNPPATGTNDPNETLVNTTTAPVNVTYVYSLIANGCTNNQNVVVQVGPSPVLTSAPNPSAVCSNSVFSYIPLSSTIGTTFAWSRSATSGISNASASGNGNLNEILFNTTSSPVNVTYVYTLSAAGCPNPVTFNVVVAVQPLPAAAGGITGTSTICQGGIGATYNVPPIAGATGYVWTLPFGTSIVTGSNTNSITVNYSNSAASGVVKVYGTNSCGSGVASPDFPVTVNALPAAAALITGPAVACQGSTGVVYSIPAIASATSYTWTLPSGFSVASGSGTNTITVNYTLSATSGTISVYGTNTCGNGTAASLPVTVNPNPILTSTLTPSAICSNTIFSYPATGTPAGVIFSWTRAAVAGISNGAASGTGNPNETLINTTTAPVSVTYVYSVSANGCTGSTTYNVVVVVNPAPVLSGTLTPPSQCNNTPFTYTAASATSGSTFAWSRAIVAGISNVAGSGSGNINETLINTTTSPVNVTYIFTISANGCSNVQNVVVTVNPTPVLTSSQTPTAICSNTVFNYTPTSLTPGTVFTWSRTVVAGISNGAGSGTGNPNETLINTTNASIPVTYVYVLNINGCTNTQNVTVLVKPTASLTSLTTPPAICSGTPFNYSPVANVAGTTFTWSRALTTGISNAAASGSGDPNEMLVNTTTAPVDVTYVYTLNSGGCTSTTNVVVRINPTPTLSSTLTPSAICNNSLFTYTPTSGTGGTVFSWNRSLVTGISNPPANGTGDPNETLINTTALPVYVPYIYTLTANGCSNTQNVNALVNPSPVLTSILTMPAICSNTAVSYTPTSSTPGATFAWSRVAVLGISNASATGNGNPNEILYNTTNAPVNVTYVYTLSIGGCANPTTYNVVVAVNPTPSLSSLLTPAPICSGSLFIYTATSTSIGASMTWTRPSVAGIVQSTASGSGSISEFLTNSTALPINVTYVYTTTLNGCNSSQNVVVTVNPLPVLSSSLTIPALCSGFTLNYNATSNTPGTIFTWSRATLAGILQTGTNGTGNISEVLTNTTLAPVQVTYVYNISANGCPNPATYNVVVTVYPTPQTPVITASGPTSFCAGSSVTLTAPAGFTYQWSNGATTQSIVVSSAGSYSVFVIDANGCNSAPSAPVLTTVTPSATVYAGANGTVCEGDNFVIPPGAYALNYSVLLWSTSGTGTFSGNGTITPTYTPSAVDALNGAVFLTLTAGNIAPCAGNVHDDMILTIQSAPIANAGTDKTVCYPNSILISGTATGFTNPRWTHTGTGVLLNPNTLTPTYFPDVNDVGNTINLTLTVDGRAPCTITATDVMQLSVDALPANPGAITGISPVCKGVTTTYFIASLPNVAVNGYTWSVPLGATIVAGNNTSNIQVNFGPAAVSGNISVYGTNGCGNGIVATLPVIVNDVPLNPGSISGNAQVCQGATGVTYSVSPVAGATSYVWTVPTGATITSTLPYTNSITVDFDLTASSGNVTVYAVNSCGNGATAIKNVTLNAKPPTPVITAAGGVTTVCEGNSVPLIGASGGYNYLWTPGGSTAQINMVTVTGNYSVVVTNPVTGCSSDPSNTIAVTINPAPAAPTSIGFIKQCIIVGPLVPPLDAGTITNVPGTANIVWYNAATGGVIVASPTLGTVGSVTYWAEAQDIITNCPSLTRTPVTLTLATYPVAPVKGTDVSNDDVICETSPITALSATTLIPPPAGTVYRWYGTPTGGLPVNPTISTVGSQTFYAEADNGICTSPLPRTPVTLTIEPAPLPPVSGGDITDCEMIPVIQTLTATASLPAGVPAGSTITWYDHAVNGSVVIDPSLNTLGTVTYYAETTNFLTSCTSLTRTPVTLSIIPHPAPPVANPIIIECEKSPLQTLTATATVPIGSTVTWYDQATNGSIIAPTLSAVGTITVYAETDNGSCTSLSRTPVVLTIISAPLAPVSTGNIVQCETTPLVPLDAANALLPVAGTDIEWYDSPGLGNTVPAHTLTNVGTITYYAEARNTITGCRSLTRTAVTLTINPTPEQPLWLMDIKECVKSPIQTIDANNGITKVSGVTYTWYDAATLGVVTGATINFVGTKTVYAESSIGSCINATRTPVALTIDAAPPAPVSLGDKTECSNSANLPLIPVATAPGYAIDYYTAPSGGFAVDPTLLPLNEVGTRTYYAEARDLLTGCTSLTRSAAIVLTVNNMPEPPVAGPDITDCASSPIQKITATATVPSGVTLIWYNAAVGGTVVSDPSLNIIGSKSYWAAAKIGTCENATRVEVKLQIDPVPATPVPIIQLPVCEGDPIQTLLAGTNTIPGATIDFYTTPTGGTPVSNSWSEVGTITLYAEARNTTTGCVSLVRSAPIVLTIKPTPKVPVSMGDKTECISNPAQVLIAEVEAPETGTSITWYDAATAGNVVSSPTLNIVATKDYWAEAKIGTCVSARTKVTLKLNASPARPVPIVTPPECADSLVQTLTAQASIPGAPAGITYSYFLDPIGGSPVAPTLSEVGTVTYYAEASNGTCVSTQRSVPIVLTINPTPKDPVSLGDITECVTNPVQLLIAQVEAPDDGTTITWFDAPTLGNAVSSPTLNSIGTKSYWAEAKIGTCVSINRTQVTLKINPAPARPTPIITPPECANTPVQTITAQASAPGSTISWYTTPTGGIPVSPTLSEVGTVTYYAEASDGTCTSILRSIPIILTITETPAPPVSLGDISECVTNPIQLLTAQVDAPVGTTITWYDKATLGNVVGSPTLNSVGTKTYWAEASIGSCKSISRTAVILTIGTAPAVPLVSGNITQCEDPAGIQILNANSVIIPNATANVIWYDSPTLGFEVVPEFNSIGTITYYAEARDKATDCPSVRRTPVILTINPLPQPPVSSGPLSECLTTPVHILDANNAITIATGTKIKWYDSATGGATVSRPILNAAGTITYYVESIDLITGCVSATRTPVVLTISPRPVAPSYSGTGIAVACESDPFVPLDANDEIGSLPSGVTLSWFTTSVAGFPVANPLLNTTGTVTYYAETVENSCSSVNRVPVKLTINPASVQPVSKGDTWECVKNPVQTLNANNNIINLPAGYTTIWYKTATGPDTITYPRLSIAGDSITYYASFKNNTTGCLSLQRKAVQLTISAPPPASAASNSPLSVGQTLNLKGGPEDVNLTYTWLTPDGGLLSGMDVSIPNVTERSAGFYKLTITDRLGCSSYDSTRVFINTATIDYLKPVCLGGTLYLSGGPVLPGATYFWTGPDGFTSNDQNPYIDYLTLSKSGDYSLKVTDRNGFITTATVNITIKPLPIAMAGSNVPVCFGGTLNLTAGPNGMSSYSWTGPTGPLTGKNLSLTNYSPTTLEKFVLTVVDFNGCEATDTITATIFKPKASSNSPVCQGDTLRLRALDNGMASYRWSGPNGFSSTRQNPVLTGVTTAGTYTLSVTDNSGCVASSDPVNVVFNPRPSAPVLTGTGIVVACESDPFVQLDARNEIVAGGPGITLNWFTAPAGGSLVSDPVLDKSGSITYYAASVQNSCPSTIRVPVKLTVNPAPVQPISKGETRECAKNPRQTLNANDNITNLTSGYSTVWYKSASGNDTITNPTFSIAGDSIIYYAAFKNDTTGCLSLQRTAVKLTILAPGMTSAASNSPLALGATLILRGGPDVPDVTYNWVAPNGNTFSTMDVTIPNITADAAGMYRLTVTGQNGCSAYDSTNVVIAMAIADYARPVCLGGTLYFSGGPDNMASYSWVGPDGFTSFDQNPSINNVTLYKAGDYTLTVTDMNGGITTATVNVSLKSPPIAMADANNPVCAGSNLNLLGRPNGMSSYIWEGPNGFTSNLQNPIISNYNPADPEKYILRITDVNGCEASDTIITTVFRPIASANNPVCQGDTLRLRAEPNGMSSYRWTGPNGFQSNFQNPSINKVNAALATGVYTLTVTTPSGCTASVNINISFNPPPPTVTITPDSNPVCQGSTLTLTADPPGMASYSWVGPNGFKSTVQNPQIPNISAAAAGKYTLTVKTPNGCTSSATMTLAIVKASFNGTYGPFCFNDPSVTLSATPGGGIFSGTGVTGNRFDPVTAGVGSHIISYIAPIGSCPVAPITISVVSTPVVVTNNTSLASCNGTADLTLPEVTAGSDPGLVFTYWADSGATQRIANPKAVALGTWYIKGATPSGNCYDVKPVTVNPSDALQAIFVSVSPACSSSATGSIEVVVTKGTAPYTYQWDTNPVQTTSKITDLPAGVYTVIITDSTLCSITLTETLRDHPGVKIHFAHKDIQCLSDANGTARVDSITFGGKPSILNLFTYKWNTTPEQTTREATRLSYGYHTVTMTDAKGCGIKDSIFIDVLDTIPPTIDCRKDTITVVVQSNSTDPLGSNPNTVIVELGKPTVWDNCGVASLTNDAPEKYRVGLTRVIWTVTDFVGLTDTCSQVVYVKAIPTVPNLFTPNGDGINDYFEIDGLKDFPKSKLYVYTRSGQLVFSSEDYNNEWDGRFQTSKWSHNQFVAPGVYYYILNLGTINRKIQGFVYIYY